MADQEKKEDIKKEEKNKEKKASNGSGMGLYIVIASVIFFLGIVVAAIFFTPLGKMMLGGTEQQVIHQEPATDEILPSEGPITQTSENVDVKEELRNQTPHEAKKVEFITLPDSIVNIRGERKRSHILKAVFLVEVLKPEDKVKVESSVPIIVDQFQSFLRELEVSDLYGAAGLERVRQELLARLNTVISPVKSRYLLVKEFLIQ